MENLKTTYYNVNFNKYKEQMARDLFSFYNVAVFDNKVWALLFVHHVHTCAIFVI